MRRFLKRGLICLFTLLLLLGAVTVHTTVQALNYGKLINYAGIVRGASQRLVKLELEGQEEDEMIQYLDSIFKELKTGRGSYGIPLTGDKNYQKHLQSLNQMWEKLKIQIQKYRKDGENRSELLTLSEKFFVEANEMVFAADAFSYNRTRGLLIISGVMIGSMLLTWIFIFWAASKKMLLLENTNKELSELTRKDILTGAYQMDAFGEKTQKILDKRGQKKYAIVYTDFADFKYVNDIFGYAYGDSILKKYGEILCSSLREDELCGRVFADNFVLLMRYEEKEEIARRQKENDKKIAQFMREGKEQQSILTYCGICCLEDVIEELKIEELLNRANFARKTVKNGTKPNYVYYDESIRARLWEEKAVENRMYGALARREFKVYYQPKVSLKTGRIACSEALVRWVTSDGTVISPGDFIPVFERKLLIGRLDRYVFEEVCRFLRQLLDMGQQPLPVSVNVSRLQFYEKDFVKNYVEIRDKYQIPPCLLEIEFTESVVFDNMNLLFGIVQELKEEGFSCSIDDFGKGYSSFGLLKSLPINVLKIDSLFFDEGEDKEKDMAIVQGIVELMRKLGIHTVAEGIERQEQVEFLERIGCDYIQGYFFFKPMPEKEFEHLITREIPWER